MTPVRKEGGVFDHGLHAGPIVEDQAWHPRELDADAADLRLRESLDQHQKEFLLRNVPNRVSHNAPCTVVIVQTNRGGS